jgi:HlyD family secretion protein
MKFSYFLIILLVLLLIAAGVYYFTTPSSTEIKLTGIVTGNEVIASPQTSGRLDKLYVDEGDSVKTGQLIGELDQKDLRAARDAAADNIQTYEARLTQSSKQRTLDAQQTDAALKQAEANLMAVQQQLKEEEATLALDQTNYQREQGLFDRGVVPAQDRDNAESAYKVAQATVQQLQEQIRAGEDAVNVAKANQQQVGVQESDMQATRNEIAQAVQQKNEAQVQLGYTAVKAPLDGIVSVRVARQGEIVQEGAPIVTILDIDHLWVQADVEETYADQITFGEKMRIQMQSGDEVEGTVFFKGVENDFATQRDVSRTKRDIKTFEIKLSIPNPDRRFIAGMTAYVILPQPQTERHGFHF